MDADIVVIGAGSFGSSAAYHLAKLGGRVILIDQFEAGSQTSMRAAGLATPHKPDYATHLLAKRSIDKVARFNDETGQSLEMRRVGGMKLARTDEYADRLRNDVPIDRQRGLFSELLDNAEAKRRAPYINPERAKAVWWSPHDVYFHPADLPNGYLRAARGLGVAILENRAVRDVLVRHDSIVGVATDDEVIHTPVVVNAAGAWSARVGAMAGVSIPIVPVRHQLYVTEPLPSVSPEMPIVRVVDAQVYVRPESGGLMMGGYEPNPLTVNPIELLRGVSTLLLDREPLRRLTVDVAMEYPGLESARWTLLRGGLPTMTSDGQHIFSDTKVRGFFVMTGCLVGGLSISPAAGEAMAHWITTGEEPSDMSPFKLSRFGSGSLAGDQLTYAALAHYSRTYRSRHA